MGERTQYGESDPRHHTAKLKQMLRDVAVHAREDEGKVLIPRRRRCSKLQRKCAAGAGKGLIRF
jgi:hypothetical protein